MPDLEDKEGEVSSIHSLTHPTFSLILRQTALHKAALNGHISIVKYLLPERADVYARDADGWTALHNACSKVGSGPIFVWQQHSSLDRAISIL